ncbi:hypothetical protein EXM22_05235 [Oceanispirochaeta crateris]|uniref:Uncharacterized protein n=1 Tax=Oceanispirochaeta crateris TaxID=2518645 RepID=A0A5C1QIK6_9SPIO|nr:hypothetical protein [Oceanispirochaeta crateris]QEN07421.1 hypothetical protein EXM22_05235 [Oceanispirochaeta crateris]
MKRDDFVSTIGYSGNSAIADKKLQKPGTPIETLLELGLYKAAFSKALYDENVHEQEMVLEAYNKASKSSYKSIEELKRLFGVFRVPDKITRVKRI